MEEGTFGGWLKHDGDTIQRGDNLFVLESDKAAQEIESFDAGILRIPPDGPKPGDQVKVGQVLAHLVAANEPMPPSDSEQPPAEAAASETVAPVPAERISEPDLRRQSHTARARHQPANSPRARRVAVELGIDWRGLKGSGRDGRIRERDVRAAADDGNGQLIPHSHVRRTIAERMVVGVNQAAPVTLTTKVPAANLVSLRDQFKTAAATPDDLVPSYTDLIVKLAAVALRQHPLLQAQWRDEGLFVPNRIDIAFSVDTEAGLLVPVVRAADLLTLREVVAQTHELIDLARSRQLTAEQMRNATFTVTNLGGFGVDAFTPIINLPQCAVLGVGRIVREPAVVSDQIVPRDMVTLSLTFDHRVVDGAPAARFLQTLRGCLENPVPWLM
jgi:pyruvate dehydrogenase E2 component (dihydrolipoamide acetyltransferase)